MAERKNNRTENSPGIAYAEKSTAPWLTPVRKLCILLAVISCLVYANTLSNGYVLDDSFMITYNNYVKEGIKGIPELLTTPHLKGYAPDLTDTYRPLSLVMFALEYQFFGENPAIGHFFNIITFAACVVALFMFLYKLFDKEQIIVAFIAALLFALHPIHTEVVANIKSRDELLSYLFAFLALNAFIDYALQGKLKQLLLGTLCFSLSIISKETSATFIVIIPLIFFFYKNDNRKRSILITFSTFFVFAAFVIIRAIMINLYKADGMIQFSILDNELLGAPSFAARMATIILVLGHYLQLVIIPYPLISNYSYPSIPFATFADPYVLLSTIAYLALIIAAIYLLFKNKKDPWAFGILFYLVTLSIFSNVLFIAADTQADRFTFFASSGICLLIALVVNKLMIRSYGWAYFKNLKVIPLLLICFLYAGATISRNADWKDNYTLFSADTKKSPNNTRLNSFVATELQKKYEEETDPTKKVAINTEAIMYLNRSIEIYPLNDFAHAELGTSYILAAKPDSAIIHFEQALQINPKMLIAISNLGTLYAMQGKFKEATPYYLKTIAMEPQDTVTWFNLAIGYMQLQKNDSALYAFKKVITLDPSYNNYMAYANTAVLYRNMGQMDSAQKYLQIARQYIPQQPQ